MQLFRNPSLALIKRNQGCPCLRRYAVLMARVARGLFGDFKYGTIAKLTNVALLPTVKVSTESHGAPIPEDAAQVLGGDGDEV